LQVCRDVVAAAVEGAENLLDTAAKAGVENVVYVFYPQIPGSLLGVFATSPNEILEYALPMERQACEQAETRTNSSLRCYFLDLQPFFENHPELFADDGIHENAMGSAVIANEVQNMLKAHGID
jgi:hypothetical protein